VTVQLVTSEWQHQDATGRVVSYSMDKRQIAEREAAALGVPLFLVEDSRTTTECRVQWIDHQRGCPGPCRHWKLVDGDEFIGTVNTDGHGGEWFVMNANGVQIAGPFGTLPEAQEMAVAVLHLDWVDRGWA